MKWVTGWLQPREQQWGQHTSTSPDPSAVEDLKDVCLSGGPQWLGVDLVMRQYYGDYNH